MTASPGRTDQAPATLLVLSGPVRGSRIEVPADGVLFGRAAGPPAGSATTRRCPAGTPGST